MLSYVKDRWVGTGHRSKTTPCLRLSPGVHFPVSLSQSMAERLIAHSSLQGSEIARLLLAPSAAAAGPQKQERTIVCEWMSDLCPVESACVRVCVCACVRVCVYACVVCACGVASFSSTAHTLDPVSNNLGPRSILFTRSGSAFLLIDSRSDTRLEDVCAR